jgi:ribokinase
MDKILVIGSYNVGLTVFGPTIPKAGQTILGDHFDMGPGGKGSNQAICIARLGGNVTFLAKIGDDIFGKDAMALFKREGINTDYIRVDGAAHTGAGIIFVDKDCHNAIGVAPGANYKLCVDDLDADAGLFEQSRYLLMQMEIPVPVLYHAIEKAKKSSCKVILNPAPAQKLDPKYIAMVDILTPNESEAQILTDIAVENTQDAIKAARSLVSQGAGAVIVTLGAKGCVLVSRDAEKHYPAYKVKPVDTTGAGDAFNGGLVYALAKGQNIDEAIDFASKVAAISVTSIGCVLGLPTLKNVEQFRGEKA